jgi:abelson tyrosine-protein kinase 1
VTLPLWTPTQVNLGDVGFLEKPAGSFRTLFNSFNPEGTSNGAMKNCPRLQGYGDVKTNSQRLDKRNAAQRGFDAIQQWNPFRKTGNPVYVLLCN